MDTKTEIQMALADPGQTGQDLNTQAATKIMGWTLQSSSLHDPNLDLWVDADGQPQCWAVRWRPAEDRNQLGRVVNRMFERGFHFSLFNNDADIQARTYEPKNGWLARFDGFDRQGRPAVHMYADLSIGVAVIRAALQALWW